MNFFKKKIIAEFREETKVERTFLQKRIADLELELVQIKGLIAKANVEKAIQEPEKSTIIIENLSIEAINIDTADLSNNFGQLGIKDLTGQLYIGTNSQTTLPNQASPPALQPLIKKAPKFSIHSKKENKTIQKN
ncbi:hypothetical protein [Sutcliffiella rhizosphaerae]|uniref:hypothetical protein n=1 Tax=Sutcliffiella rhizosphaerae TaxID=2880967 RepID=UPI001E54A9BD|nr:hypothetical protein [Sutcliffiella rhizosphaerae]